MTARDLVGRAYVPRRGRRDVEVLTAGFNWQRRQVPPRDGVCVTKRAIRPLIEAAMREARASDWAPGELVEAYGK